MSDTVLVVLIIAVAIVIVLLVFREQLSRFIFKANKEGIEAQLDTRQEQDAAKPRRQAGVTISKNKQFGKGNVIDVGRNDVDVEDNTQLGEDQKIMARPDNPANSQKAKTSRKR